MAIHHELSSDIAVALLAGKEKNPDELNNLKEVVFRIHKALEQTTEDPPLSRKRSRMLRQAESRGPKP